MDHPLRHCDVVRPDDAASQGFRSKFRVDDASYLARLAAHPDGYVINIARSQSATEAPCAPCWLPGDQGQILRGSGRYHSLV